MTTAAPFRNIHFSAAAAAPDASQAAPLPRLRFVKNSPSREYAARPGAVERLPDALAAIILSEKQFLTVSRSGLQMKRDGKAYKYWSENSAICNDAAYDGKRVVCVFNRNDLSRVHVMTDDGCYIETLPLKGRAEFFDEATAGRELAKHRRAQDNAMRRMQEVHGADTVKAVTEARENAGAMRTVVTTMPRKTETAAPGTGRREVAPAPRRATEIAAALQGHGATTRGTTDLEYMRKRARATTPAETVPA